MDKDSTQRVVIPWGGVPFIRKVREELSAQSLIIILCVLLFFLGISEYFTYQLAMIRVGLIGHGVILLSVLGFAGLAEDKTERRVYAILTLAPLVKVIAFSLPLEDIPQVYWVAVVGMLIALAALLVMRYSDLNAAQVGLTTDHWFAQLLFGLIGIDIGYLSFLFLKPDPLVTGLTMKELWLPTIILMLFTGFLEELIYRGLVQRAFIVQFGTRVGIILTTALYTIMHIGGHSLYNLVFIFCVGFLFGVVRELTGSILGVSIAHGLTNIALYLIFPLVRN